MGGELPAPVFDMTVREATGVIDALGTLEANGLLQSESIRRVAVQAIAKMLTELSKAQFQGHELLSETMDLLDAGTIETAQGIIAHSEEISKANTETLRNRYNRILAHEIKVTS